MDETLIKALQNPKLYSHEVQGFEVMQTHISWVILTGQYAYKIKKPVNFGFCDFTSVEKRKHFCELEIQLNKRLASDLYINLTAITGTPDNPQIDGDGPVIDYAIKMHQFEQNRLLSNVLKDEGLSRALMLSLADQIAQFHQKAEKVSTGSPYGTPEQIFEPMLDNFRVLNQLEPSRPYAEMVEDIATWAKTKYDHFLPILKNRQPNGYVVAAHGDMHLGNMVLIQGMPVIFDCIEFNDDFRFTDTMGDTGFIAMDLDDKGYENLSFYLCNRYFEATQDYQGALILDFYKSYRAMVRAKIMAYTIDGLNGQEDVKQTMLKDLENFIKLAQTYKSERTPSLTITFGPSGSGKSHYTDGLLIEQKALRLRSDVIRKQLCALDPYEACPEDKKAVVYSEDTTKKVYDALLEYASMLLKEGWPVIIDATNLKAWQRAPFIKLAQDMKVPFKILQFEQDATKLKSRLEQRNLKEKTSDADVAVLEKQLDWLEPLSAEEKNYAQRVEI